MVDYPRLKPFIYSLAALLCVLGTEQMYGAGGTGVTVYVEDALPANRSPK